MVIPIIAAGIAVIGLGGVGLAIVAHEVANDDDTIVDKAETSLVRLGYVSTGIAKGALVSVPPCVFALLILNYGLKAQKRIIGE